MVRILRIAWERWRIIGHVNADYVGRIVTVAFYYTVLVPFAIGARLLMDPLKLKRPAAWSKRPPVGTTLDEARSQF